MPDPHDVKARIARARSLTDEWSRRHYGHSFRRVGREEVSLPQDLSGWSRVLRPSPKPGPGSIDQWGLFS